jgi:hypothetical protein
MPGHAPTATLLLTTMPRARLRKLGSSAATVLTPATLCGPGVSRGAITGKGGLVSAACEAERGGRRCLSWRLEWPPRARGRGARQHPISAAAADDLSP